MREQALDQDEQGEDAGLPSIRQRLSSALIVISLAWGIVVSAAVGWAVQREVDELLDNRLQEAAEILLGTLNLNLEQLPLGSGEAMAAPAHEEQTVWQIVDAQGGLLLRSHRAPALAMTTMQAQGFAPQGGTWRVFALPFDSQGRMLYVGQLSDARQEALFEAIKYSTGAALVVGLAGALWLRLRVRRELQPILLMSSAVAGFDPLRADHVLSPPTRAELMPVHRAITGLGRRLALQVSNERAFAAHAAHALRTPLAAMVANLAVAQRRAGPGEQAHLQRAREAADRLRRVVTALLTMFRSGGEVNRRAVDIGQLILELPFENLSIDVTKAMPVNADPDLLAAALLNLLDNAARHGATAVRVLVGHDGLRTQVQLQDNGSGLAEATRQRLQDALDAQDYDGKTGLGLMLSDIVARAHGGRLQLLPTQSGCCVAMSFGD